MNLYPLGNVLPGIRPQLSSHIHGQSLFLTVAGVYLCIRSSEFKKLQFTLLAVKIMGQHFQAGEEHCLPEDALFLTELVQYLHGVAREREVMLLLISNVGQGIGQNLIKPIGGQHFGDSPLERIHVTLREIGEIIRPGGFDEFNFVESVNAQNFLHYIGLLLYIHPVGRDGDRIARIRLSGHNNVQSFEDVNNLCPRDGLSNQSVYVLVFYLDDPVSYLFRIDIYNLRGNQRSCNLFEKQGGTLQGVNGKFGIRSTRKPKGGICFQLVVRAGLSDVSRGKARAFQKDGFCCLRNA